MLKHLFKNYSVLWLVKISNGQWLRQWPSFQKDAVGRGLAATCTLYFNRTLKTLLRLRKQSLGKPPLQLEAYAQTQFLKSYTCLNTHIKSLWLMWEEKSKHPFRMLLAVFYLNKHCWTVLKDFKIPAMKSTFIMQNFHKNAISWWHQHSPSTLGPE